jgi:hypothetical protein
MDGQWDLGRHARKTPNCGEIKAKLRIPTAITALFSVLLARNVQLGEFV